MCGSIVLGDLPYEDKSRIRKFTLEVNMNMTDEEILDKIIYHLENKNKMRKMINFGLKWANEYTTEKYNNILYNNMIKTSGYFKNKLKLRFNN